jgi:hypothetical protein
MMKYIVLLFSLVLIACSNTQGLTTAELNQAYRDYIAEQSLESKDRVSSFKFRGWQTLTNDFLILSSSPQKKYLVEVNGFCDELRYAQALILNRSIASSLQTRFDSIATPKMPNLKCFIKAIYPIDKQQAKVIAALDDQATEPATENQVSPTQS